MERRLIAGRWVRWSKETAAAAYANGSWTSRTLADTLREAAARTPDRVILIDKDHRIDCQSLCTQATALAGWLLSRTVAGSVVSFMLPNWYEAVVVYLGATLAGMVVNPILPSLRDRELSFILKDADSRILFLPAVFRQFDYAAMINRVASELDRPPEIVILRGDGQGHTSFESTLTAGPDRLELPQLDPDAVRMVLYTSGTTGRPKGVLHSHNSIHAMMHEIGRNWLFEAGDTLLVPSPVGHITGSYCAVECPLLFEATALLMDQWNALDAVRLVDSERCTHIVGATPFLEQALAAARSSGTHLSTLKLFACGGASVPPSLIKDAAGYFDRAVVTRVYGSTEVPLVTVGVMNPDDVLHAAQSDGRTDLADVKLAEHPAASSGEGEICARGPQMLVGYQRSEDEVDAFDSEGYFRTGDIGRWDDGDYLVVTGRAKDIIIRNGENISPKELEDLLARHPNIAEVSVVGIPDARTGERACAVIVAKSLPAPEVAGLRAFLGEQGVAPFKAPEQVILRESLPKNDAGKILKHVLRAELTQASIAK